MSGPRQNKRPSGGWRVIAVVILGMSIVMGLAGIRYYRGENIQATASGPRIETSADVVSTLQDLHISQQQVIDELQITRDQLIAQKAEIKRLTQDLQAVTQKLDTLRNSFASEPVTDPAKD